MQSEELRQRFLDFFEKRGHAIIPSASLVPENDPSVLFTTAGMQPLVPYLLGQPHPKGNKLVNSQKCVRTQDIDEVGDNTHDTFFEMLGNWSLGAYFKEDAIKWSYEFLTNKEEGLGLEPSRLYVTVFGGNIEVKERDEESFEIWKSVGIPQDHIYFIEGYDNWWSPGDNGPCGTDTEMFYDVVGGLNLKSKEEFQKADEEQKVVEIWNDVFMEYEKKDGKVVGKLKQKNVDTGAGLERLLMVMQGKDNVFDTDLFTKTIEEINNMSSTGDARAERIVADHIRTAVFMILDGVTPSNTDQGYILRRLLRRAVRYADNLGIKEGMLSQLALTVIDKYKNVYPNLFKKKDKIVNEITKEEEKFRKTLKGGLKEFKRLIHIRNEKGFTVETMEISGKDFFNLFQTYGFPFEMVIEEMKLAGLPVYEEGMRNTFNAEMKKHQELSRSGAEQKFKGGLADTSEKTTMLHTTTHLMLAGLRKVLGDHVHQAGSNITQERTRFDFTHPEKVSREDLDKVEEYVNEAVSKKCPVVIERMKKEDAQRQGVEGSFWEKYPDEVDVYVVKCPDGTVYSQELCGGPHVKNTGDIKGTFHITKEKASSAGVRRIKGALE